MKTKTEKPLIEEPPRWLCRVDESKLSEKTGKRTVTAKLIYGHESEPDEHHVRTVTGPVHYKITGSTAESSIREMAKRLNERKTEPSAELDECFADKPGWEAFSKKHYQTEAIPLPPSENPELLPA